MKLETELRNLKREEKHWKAEMDRERGLRRHWENRAVNAELEAKKWEARFDELLTHLPTLEGPLP